MAFLLGFDPTTTVSDPNEGKAHALLTRNEGQGGKVWIYVQASGAIDQYDYATVDEAGQATKGAKAGVDDNHKVGFAQVAFADNDYGWLQILGPTTFNVTGVATTIDLPLYTSGTAGVLSVTSTTSQTLIHGVCATANAGTTAETSVAGLMATEPQSAGF